MDTNTMIVRLVEALLWFSLLALVVVRLDRLWLRLRHFQLNVLGWVRALFQRRAIPGEDDEATRTAPSAPSGERRSRYSRRSVGYRLNSDHAP